MPTLSALAKQRKAENERRKKEKEMESLASAQRMEEEKKKRQLKKKERDEARTREEEVEKSKNEEAAQKKKEEIMRAEAESKATEEKAKRDDQMNTSDGTATNTHDTELDEEGGGRGENTEEDKGINSPMRKKTRSGKGGTDTADCNINDHLNDINKGGEGEEKEEEDEDDTPQRKKKKKDKDKEKKSDKKGSKKNRKRKNKPDMDEEEKEENDKEEEITTPVLRRGRFSLGSGGSGTGQVRTAPTYSHAHKRWVLDCSLVLKSDGLDKYPEMQHALKMLLINGRKVDPTLVIEPVVEGVGERIDSPEDIPINFTDLSSNFKMSGGLKAFEMKTPWKRDGDNREEVELQDPEVYFAVAFSSDVKPSDIVERISCEWGRINGKKMWLKAIKSFQTETPIALYHLLNSGHQATILTELKGILEEARDREAELDMCYVWEGHDIPELGMRLNVPKIPGQDTTVFKNWPHRSQWYRKVLHVECDSNAVPMIQDLVAVAKRRGLFKPVWGKNVRVSNTAGDKTKPQDLTNMSRYVRRHVNYHSSMIYDGLVGINDLDIPVPFYAETDADKVMGHMTLRYVLYRFVKVLGGHSLFREIHQENALASVDVAIPNAPEAETMVAMMNKNLGAFLSHYLKGEGLDEKFVDALVQQSIDPQVFVLSRSEGH